MQQNAHFAAPGASRTRFTHEDWHYPEESVPGPSAQRHAPGRPGRRLAWPDRLLLTAVALLLLGLHLRAGADDDTLGLDDIASGAFLVQTATPGEYLPATRLATRATFDVSGPLVRASVKQAFRNDSGDWVEGTYVFPLPDEAAVDQLRLVVGNRVIEGEIQERKKARQTYETARDTGQVASLVEQERPNLFTTSVANIAPGEEILVEIGYQQILKPSGGVFQLRFPLTLTQRYVPPPAATELANPQKLFSSARDALRITPPMADSEVWDHPVDISVHVDAGLPLLEIRSHHHDIIMEPDKGNRYTVILADDSIPADRDFVLSWTPVLGTTPEALAFSEIIGDERFALVMLLPPEPERIMQVPPRDLILVVDTSGSMHGESMRQAREALVLALGSLRSQDRFDVIEFNSTAHSLFGKLVPSSPFFVSTARRFVEGLEANGGTEMAAALHLALNRPQDFSNRLRQVVFVTDGSVGNEAELFEQISRDLGRTRLFTVGIGSAPNSWFMRQAAVFGRGSYTFIGSISDVGERMEELFAKLENPALTGLEVTWSVPAESFPDPVPDVYAGEPVLVTARLPVEQAFVELRGDDGWTRRVYLDDALGHPGIARLWARARVEDLENLKVLGADPEDTEEMIIETALSYGLVSKYTSLVAVDKTPVRLASTDLKSEMLPVMRPAGSTVNFTATATDARLWMLIGLACFAFALSWTMPWARP